MFAVECWDTTRERGRIIVSDGQRWAWGTPRYGTPPQKQRARDLLLFEQGGRCEACGILFEGPHYSRQSQLDHIWPRAFERAYPLAGDVHEMANLRLLCQPCNLSRRDDGLVEAALRFAVEFSWSLERLVSVMVRAVEEYGTSDLRALTRAAMVHAHVETMCRRGG